MNINIEYVVMPSREPPNTDLGYWSRHSTRASAAKTLKSGGGSVWKKTDKDGRVILTEIT